MADPLSALAIAAAVVQFVDFGSRIVIDGYGSYRSINGASRSDVDVRELAEDLKTLCSRISPAAGARTLDAQFESPDDQARLRDIASRCLKLAIELAQTLQVLVVESGGTMRVWDIMRKTIKRKLGQRKIKILQGDLEITKSQLALHMLNAIRNSQSSTMLHLSALKAHASTLHENYIVELANVRDGLVEAIEQLNGPIVEIATQRKVLEDAITRANDVESLDAKIKTKTILKSLRFPEVHHRESGIHDAHQQTFEWIFKHEAFTQWLSQGSGLYWISGKAGSGKSTFMKFLVEHENTRRLLQSWAGKDKLAVLSFYLWASGVPMQKTQEGLFRSLLLQLLSCCPPSVIAECLPRRWTAMDTSQHISKPWTNKELLGSLKLVMTRMPNTKFCIFIDGLDEFLSSDLEGDHHDFIQVIPQLLDSANTKICVSSRPWPEFRASYPQYLVLQDFTKSDIELFVTDLLNRDQRFLRLAKNNRRAPELARELTMKANGVFLWVFLSVRSLLRGLGKYDDFEVLRTRLRALPSDMKTFFQRMLDGIEDIYVESAVCLLKVAAIDGPLPLLIMNYIPMELKKTNAVLDPDLQLCTELLDYDARKDFEITSSNRVNAWCGDLLEVHDRPAALFLDFQIDVLHRTVRDFLLEPETLETLHSRSKRCHEPIRLRMQAVVYEVKFLSQVLRQQNDPWHFVDTFRILEWRIPLIFRLAKKQKLQSGSSSLDLLEATSHVCDSIREMSRPLFTNTKEYLDVIRQAIRFDLPEFISANLDRIDSSLLDFALTRRIPSSEIVKILLDKGADPNARLKSLTPWESFIKQRYVRHQGIRSRSVKEAAVVGECAQLLLSHGADPFAEVSISEFRGPRMESPIPGDNEPRFLRTPQIDHRQIGVPCEWRDRYHASLTLCSDERNVASRSTPDLILQPKCRASSTNALI